MQPGVGTVSVRRRTLSASAGARLRAAGGGRPPKGAAVVVRPRRKRRREERAGEADPGAAAARDPAPLPARATAPEAFWTAAPPSGPASSLPPPARTASLFAQTGLSPRLLSAEQAAAYCGMSRSHYDQHIRPHLKPLRFGSRLLFDRIRLDEVLDQLSSPLAPVPPDNDALAARLRAKRHEVRANPNPQIPRHHREGTTRRERRPQEAG